jgi:hypothetical protein
MIKNINVIFGKPVKGIKNKKSEKPPIFFRYLPYWKEFEIGHAIDTMHVEKGVFKSTIGLLLGIPSKTKDGFSACKDLQALEIREELHPQEGPNRQASRHRSLTSGPYSLVDSLGKEPKERNQSLTLLTKKCVRHILASCIS